MLAIAYFDPQLLQLEEHRWLDDIDSQRHVGHALGDEDGLDLARGVAKERRVAANRASQAQQSRTAMVVVQPGRVQAMMLGRGAKIPDVGIAVSGQQRVTRQLVARPITDDGAGDVSDVVLIEAEQRAQPRLSQRGAGSCQTIIVKAAEVDALLEVDLRVARRLQRAIPAIMRLDVVGPDDLRFAGFLARHHSCPTQTMDRDSRTSERLVVIR